MLGFALGPSMKILALSLTLTALASRARAQVLARAQGDLPARLSQLSL